MPPNHRVGTQRCLRSSTEQCEKPENHTAPTLKIPPFLWLSFAGGFVLVFLPASEPWGCQQLSVSVVGCGNVCLNQKQHRSPSRCCIRGGGKVGWVSTAATAGPRNGAQGMRWGSVLQDEQTRLCVSHLDPEPKTCSSQGCDSVLWGAGRRRSAAHAEHPTATHTV